MLENKKRKPNTMYALVRDKWGDLRVELKSYLRHPDFVTLNYFDILCDDQPVHVLREMMSMTKET
jgi:hypothetical protein